MYRPPEKFCAAAQQNASMALCMLLMLVSDALPHEGHSLFVTKGLLLSLQSNVVNQRQQCDMQYQCYVALANVQGPPG